MAEELTFISGSKEEQYLSLLPQVRSLIEGEVDLVANLANVAAALKEAFDFFWVGFYLVPRIITVANGILSSVPFTITCPAIILPSLIGLTAYELMLTQASTSITI